MLDRNKSARTHYIHRIDYTTQERIAGAFVLVAVGILMWLMLSSGKTTHLFEDKLTIYGKLENAQSVNAGTEVQVSGLVIGAVDTVDITDNNQLVATMKILKKYHNLLRTDSTATLTSFDIALLGKSAIEISAGSPDAQLLPDGSTITITQPPSLADLADEIEPLFKSLEASIKRMNAILQSIDPASVQDTLQNANAASRNMNDITRTIKSGDGVITQTLYDPAFKQNIDNTVVNLNQASVKINQLLDALNQQAAQIPGLLNQVDPLLQEADKTIKATQRIWPLSTAVGDDEDKPTLTSPAPVND